MSKIELSSCSCCCCATMPDRILTLHVVSPLLNDDGRNRRGLGNVSVATVA